MGVFGEKHTSLTREQKRQLIHQADTHKLRPTEVCDWVQATWGLRIARVTVYSILHKQRASLMAGHKDLYQTVQNSLTGLTGSSTTTDAAGQQIATNTHASAEDCLDRNKETGRVNKYRASPNKNKNKAKDAATNAKGSENNTTTTATATTTKAASRKATESSQAKKATATSSSSNSINASGSSSNGKRDRSSSVASDRSCSSTSTAQDALGEGMSLFTNCVCLLLCVQLVWMYWRREEGVRWWRQCPSKHKETKKKSWLWAQKKRKRTQTESDAMRCDASESKKELNGHSALVLSPLYSLWRWIVCLFVYKPVTPLGIGFNLLAAIIWRFDECLHCHGWQTNLSFSGCPFFFSLASPLFPLYGFLLFVPALLRPPEQESWVGGMDHYISLLSQSPSSVPDSARFGSLPLPRSHSNSILY